MKAARPVLALVCAAALIAVGCDSDDGSSPVSGGTLRIGQENGVTTMDQLSVDNNESIWAVQQVTEPLVRVDAKGEIVPVLARSYELAPDKLAWTFQLRDGVRFSNGKRLTAEDVKFTLDAAATSTIWGFLLEPLARVEVAGPTKVVVRTKQPTAGLPAILSLFATGIMPNDYAGMRKADYVKEPIGTGPFLVRSFKPGSSLTLVRNPRYWREGLPHLERVELTGVPSETSRVSQVESGELDAVASPPWSQLSALEERDDISVTRSPLTRADLLIANAERPPFDDAGVREAVSLALDRAAIAKASLFGFGEPAGSFIAPAVPMQSGEPPARDAAQARQLLSRSSYAGEPVTLLINGEDAMSRTVGQVMQQQLSDVGLKVELRTQDLSALLESTGSGKFELALLYLTSDIEDPSELMGYFIATDGLRSRVATAPFAQPIREAAAEFDEARRAARYAEIQRAVAATNGPIAVQYQPYVYALRGGISGFDVSPTGALSLDTVRMTSP